MECLKFDGKSATFLVQEGGADFGPAFSGFSIALVLFDCKDVEVDEAPAQSLDAGR
jgi:hypothetical protein